MRGGDTHWPAHMLGAVPKRSWLKRRRRLGLEVLVPLWRQVETNSPATQRRWQWTWAIDDAVCRTYGEPWRRVGRWGSGQQPRGLSGIDGRCLVGVMGDGPLVVPVDFAMRRPDPVGAGAPCRDQLRWARTRLDERLGALRHRGLELPPPMVTGESWFGDSTRMQHVRDAHQGTVVVEGKASYGLTCADGRQGTGHDLIEGQGWRWQPHPWEASGYEVRLHATSPTYGQVTVVIVEEPDQDRVSLRGVETERSAPQLLRRWRRRHWIACVFRVLQHLLATESCQAHSDDASSGHLV